MRRTIPLIVALMLATTLLAGCFHGGDDDGAGDGPDNNVDDGDGNETAEQNNTTEQFEAANEAPEPQFSVSMVVDGNTTTDASFRTYPRADVTFIFDGSASTDADGEIIAYSWQILAPDGVDEVSNDAVFRLNLTDFGSFGAWSVTLKVLDDGNALDSLTRTFAVEYNRTTTWDIELVGPANGEREEGETKSSEVGVPGTDAVKVPTGSFNTHALGLGEGVLEIRLSATYTSGGTGGELQMYLFGKDVTDDQTKPDDASPATPIASSDVGSGGSVSLTVAGTDITEAGRHRLRLDLDGQSVTDYALTIEVDYSSTFTGDGGSDDGTGGGSSTSNNSTASLPPLPVDPRDHDPTRHLPQRMADTGRSARAA